MRVRDEAKTLFTATPDQTAQNHITINLAGTTLAAQFIDLEDEDVWVTKPSSNYFPIIVKFAIEIIFSNSYSAPRM